jgi:class 3 adenylate cyclase
VSTARKTVTILFCDVTGSTALGEELDPESLREVIQRYFTEMRAVIERHGGTVEKFIGDAVMAVFGVPQVHEDDALRAVRAAIDMQSALDALNVEFERGWGTRIRARIGVNTGEVVAADPASGQSFVSGDPVNVAARLEQAAEPGEILLGEPTYRLVRTAVIAEPLEPLAVKGKAEPLAAYRLAVVEPGAEILPRRFDSPLVGRTNELAAIRAAFEEAVTGSACRLVTVIGHAGVGKSRLTHEVVRSLADRAGCFGGAVSRTARASRSGQWRRCFGKPPGWTKPGRPRTPRPGSPPSSRPVKTVWWWTDWQPSSAWAAPPVPSRSPTGPSERASRAWRPRDRWWWYSTTSSGESPPSST